jgi:hypothetical protein
MRNPGPIQGLAAPLILALAGIGLDELIRREWLSINFNISAASQTLFARKLNFKWLVMLPALLLALYSVSEFSKNWLFVAPDDLDTNYFIQSLKTPDAQWVQPPYGDFIWLPAAMDNGLKIREFIRPWWIAGSPGLPRAYLEMSNTKDDIQLPEYFTSVGDYVILKRPDNLYASIQTAEGVSACTAKSTGGFIDVSCRTDAPGRLTVFENALPNWAAFRDGQSVSMFSGPWLAVTAPAGKHSYSFRYQPWDAPAGIGLAILGWLIVLIGLFRSARHRQPPAGENAQSGL